MQLVDGKVRFFDRRKNLRKPHAVDVRIPAEEQAVESQRDSAFHRAAEGFRQKVGNDQTLVVDAKTASAGDTRRVKVSADTSA